MAYTNVERKRAIDRIWKRDQRIRSRLKAIAILGGKCVDCLVKDERVLQFDHVEPILRTKEERLSFRNQQIIGMIIAGKLDTKTVVIRCANCHAIKTRGEMWKYPRFKGL